jgi:cystathionine beta-lyase family protein involved in aluminum resistance
MQSNIFRKSIKTNSGHRVGFSVTLDEIRDMIAHLTTILPNWIMFVDNKEGQILRMNTDLTANEVIELLHKTMASN